MKPLLTTLPLIALLTLANTASAQDLVTVYFQNNTAGPADVYFVDANQTETYYLTVPAGQTRPQQTYMGNIWSFKTRNNRGATGGGVYQANQFYTLAAAPSVTPPPRPNGGGGQGIAGPITPVQTVPALNRTVLNRAQSLKGRRVGNGQCTELAIDALRTSGASTGRNYVWGTRVNRLEEVLPGDIVQLQDAKFSTPDGFVYSWSTGPHTAIVTSVEGSKISVLEQNVSGSPVQNGSYELNHISAGTIAVYRPQPANGGGQIGGGQMGGGFGQGQPGGMGSSAGPQSDWDVILPLVLQGLDALSSN